MKIVLAINLWSHSIHTKTPSCKEHTVFYIGWTAVTIGLWREVWFFSMLSQYYNLAVAVSACDADTAVAIAGRWLLYLHISFFCLLSILAMLLLLQADAIAIAASWLLLSNIKVLLLLSLLVVTMIPNIRNFYAAALLALLLSTARCCTIASWLFLS